MTPAGMFKYCFGKRVVSEETGGEVQDLHKKMRRNGGRSLELDDLARAEPLEAHALQADGRDLAAARVLALQRVGAARGAVRGIRLRPLLLRP